MDAYRFALTEKNDYAQKYLIKLKTVIENREVRIFFVTLEINYFDQHRTFENLVSIHTGQLKPIDCPKYKGPHLPQTP